MLDQRTRADGSKVVALHDRRPLTQAEGIARIAEVIAATADAMPATTVTDNLRDWGEKLAQLGARPGQGETSRVARRPPRRVCVISGCESLAQANDTVCEMHRAESDERHRMWDEARATWARLTREERESLVLALFSGHRLTVSQLVDRVNAELSPRPKPPAVFVSNLRPLVMRMFRDGRLGRIDAPLGGRVRYRYFRKLG